MSHSVAQRITRVLAAFALLAGAVLVFVVLFCLTKIGDHELGVRVNNIPGIHGVQKDTITEPGYYFSIPRLLVIYKIPKNIITIEMVERGDIQFEEVSHPQNQPPPEPTSPTEKKKMEKVQRQMEELHNIQILRHDIRSGRESVTVKTSDGNDVWVDIIVGFRVRPEHAYLALQNIGLKTGNFESNIEALVNTVVRGKVRAFLSALHTKQVLNTTELNKALDLAHKNLNDSLLDFGLEVTSLEYQRITLHPDFDLVLQKKLVALESADQYREEAKKAKQLAITRTFQAKGEADAMIALAEGQKARWLQKAAAELTAMEYEAQAIGVKYQELAEGVAAIAAALDRPGGDQHVGLAVAQALQGKKIIIVPSEGALNLLDVNEILQSYGAALGLKKETADSGEKGKSSAAEGATEVSAQPSPPEDRDRSSFTLEVFGPETGEEDILSPTREERISVENAPAKEKPGNSKLPMPADKTPPGGPTPGGEKTPGGENSR